MLEWLGSEEGTCTVGSLHLELVTRRLSCRSTNDGDSLKSKSTEQIARAATTLAIGVVGLVIVRLIVQGLPMFRDAGWIVKGKLSVVSATLIVVDAVLLSVLIAFAVQVRAYLIDCFAEIPALGTMAASLVLLICTGIAYTEFKLVTNALPSIKQFYIWTFFALAVFLLAQITVLLFRNRDRMAALILRQPIPSSPSSDSDDPRTVLAVR